MIEYFPGKDAQWYWRYRARNGKISATGGEGYVTKSNAKRAAKRIGFALIVASSREVMT